MRKTATVGLLVAAICAPPAFATDGGFDSAPQARQAPMPIVGFTIKLKNGKPKRVEDFVFDELVVNCTEGSFVVGNTGDPLPTMKVTKKTKKFSENFRPNGGAQIIGVSGKVLNKGKRVSGKLRLRGTLTDAETGAPLTNCDSGIVKYVAKRD